MDVEAFIANWKDVPGSERSCAHSFIIQLCHLLGVPAPNDLKAGDRDYSFERTVLFKHQDGTAHWGMIDCYRRGCFVLEMKQSRKRLATSDNPKKMVGSWSDSGDRRLENARAQAEGYARALDEWPPFLINIDLGRTIELWAGFKRDGKGYTQFPDRDSYRIRLDDLRDPEIRARLAAVWMDPMSLDPSRKILAATTEIAGLLARFVRSIRERAPQGTDGKVDPVTRASRDKEVAIFVMQCLFAMFADSVGLLPDRCFSALLKRYREDQAAPRLHLTLTKFFREMDAGGYSSVMGREISRINGSLYATNVAMQVTAQELEILCAAASCDWSAVEPAIFGALMEQSLAPDERKALGAHYTPRPLVEVVVEATVIEPLRQDWEAVKAKADGLEKRGKTGDAQKVVRAFHAALCTVKVLDPACGTANFLYVAMDRMKALEGEVVERLVSLGVHEYWMETDYSAVGPRQFLGLEKNLQAVWIAKMVMWIGHLQWRYRFSRRAETSDPVLNEYDAIRQQDAILCARKIPAPETTEGFRYVEPHAPIWPPAHFIVGNPPFIAGKNLRPTLGNAYAEALWASRGGRFRSADIVMLWWDRAAEILAADAGKPGPFDAVIPKKESKAKKKSQNTEPVPESLQRFGFVTTNSITQPFSRRVIQERLSGTPPIRLTFAVPDHPWHADTGHASVRVAITVAEAGAPDGRGRLLEVVEERQAAATGVSFVETRGDIGADLSIGRGLDRAVPLNANAGLAYRGVQLVGEGFLIDEAAAKTLLALSRKDEPSPVRAYRNGKDLTDRSRNLMVIDLFGWSEDEAMRRHPGFMQHLRQTVKPGRDQNNRPAYREAWWVLGEPRRELRSALEGLPRFIVTVETSKHRWFRFMDASVLPDNRLVCIASDDPFVLGILSSRVHRAWALAAGGLLEDRPIYAKSACFDRFPFPLASSLKRHEIASTAEQMEDLLTHVLACSPTLTMTALYNVLEKMAAGAVLDETEQAVRLTGCADALLNLRERLDQLVTEAYGWPSDLTDAALVEHLVALNQLRAAEEGAGQVEFLRPAYQRPRQKFSKAKRSVVQERSVSALRPFPKDDLAIIVGVLEVLRSAGKPMNVKEVAACFQLDPRPTKERNRVKRTLHMLAAAESIHATDAGWFAPRRTSN
nr:DNA methyltransferase [uncultured Brevundimonas sp.]